MHFQSSKVFFIKWVFYERKSGGDERGMHIYVSSRKLQVWGVLGGEEEQHICLISWTQRVFIVQSCLTLCDHMSCSPSASSVLGILQARKWSGLPFPPPGDLPDPGMEPGSVSCIGRRVLYHWHHLGSVYSNVNIVFTNLLCQCTVHSRYFSLCCRQ